MASKNVCHGCLSVDRQLVMIAEHAKLYNQLLLKKSNHAFEQLMMCWECHQTLKNIQTFRMKITEAQKLLSSWSLLKPNSLSNLIVSKKINDYELILCEEEKINITQATEIEVPIVKQEKLDGLHTEVGAQYDVIYDIKTDIKEEVKNESDGFDADDNGVSELDEVLVPIALLEKKKEIKVEVGTKKQGQLEKKYRTIIMEDIPDKRNYFDRVTIDKETALQWLEEKKKSTSTKKFQCQLCYAGFAQQKFYDRHLALLHDQKNQLECELCGCRYKDRRWLVWHMNEHFVQYVCKLCGAQYRGRSQLYHHLLHGPHGRQLECKLCQARFDSNKSRDFFSHYRSAHGRPQCDHCGLRCSSKARLARHIQVSHSEYRCKLCNIAYCSDYSLTLHQKRKHEVDASERNYCVECERQFANSLLYNEHMKTSTKHRKKPRSQCPGCEKTYSKRTNMNKHYKLVHGGLRCTSKARLARHIQVRHSEYCCKLCNNAYSSQRQLTLHQKRKHEVDASERNYCVECDRQFANSLLYKEHVKTSTKHRNKPRIQCPGCEKTYSQRTTMTDHYNVVHLKESKHVCPHCDKKCLNGTQLRNHIKYLHEKVPKPRNCICTHCGKGFTNRQILENHIRTHTGERPFECTHCPASFAQQIALKTHMRSTHKDHV